MLPLKVPSALRSWRGVSVELPKMMGNDGIGKPAGQVEVSGPILGHGPERGEVVLRRFQNGKYADPFKLALVVEAGHEQVA